MSAIDEARDLLELRLSQLGEERQRLEKALAELGGKAPKRRGRKPGPRKAATGAPKKRRKRKGGNRADEAVKIITKEPGISASGIAKQMKIKPNYLYRVLGDLEKEGRVKKDKRSYTAV